MSKPEIISNTSGALMSGGVTSIYVTDIDIATRFYTECLGLSLRAKVGTEWVELDAGEGLIIGLHLARPPETVAAGSRGGINVELRARAPLEVLVAEFGRRGVRFRGPIVSYPAVRLVTAIDPDDNDVVIAQVIKN